MGCTGQDALSRIIECKKTPFIAVCEGDAECAVSHTYSTDYAGEIGSTEFTSTSNEQSKTKAMSLELGSTQWVVPDIAAVTYGQGMSSATSEGFGKTYGYEETMVKATAISKAYTCEGSISQTKGFKSSVVMTSQMTFMDKRWT